MRSLLSTAAATSRLADSEEEAIACESGARSVVPEGQSPGRCGCGGGSGCGGSGGGGGIGCIGGNGEGGGGPARRSGSGGGGAFGRDAHWLQAAHLQKEQADAVSAQKTCQHCALKVSPSTVGVQAPIATGWSVDGGRAAGSMERDQVRFDCGPKGAALIRSYHPR